jgi:hypothetical protein
MAEMVAPPEVAVAAVQVQQVEIQQPRVSVVMVVMAVHPLFLELQQPTLVAVAVALLEVLGGLEELEAAVLVELQHLQQLVLEWLGQLIQVAVVEAVALASMGLSSALVKQAALA